MEGPALYDVVSFLFQAKANFSENFKNEMLEYYFSFHPLEQRNELEKSLKYCKMIRFIQVLGAYGFRGIIQRKPHFIASLEQGIQNLVEFLKMDFTKYYKYPEASNLYTKGNELKTVQDNKMYIGFYHIHPDKGNMVGATHILEPHAYLSPINGFSYSGLSFKDTSKPSFTSNTPSTGGGMSAGGGMSGGGGYSGGGGSSGGGGY
jgi:uncharacterized membrane protein YgcG